MLCKKCKDLSTARGIKDINCRICEKDRIVNVQYSDVCTDCSDLIGMCQRCGDTCHSMKKGEDDMNFKKTLMSAKDASRETERANVRLRKSRIERATEIINSTIEEGKYAVTIDDLDEDSMEKLQEMGYIVVYNHFGKFDYTISW